MVKPRTRKLFRSTVTDGKNTVAVYINYRWRLDVVFGTVQVQGDKKLQLHPTHPTPTHIPRGLEDHHQASGASGCMEISFGGLTTLRGRPPFTEADKSFLTGPISPG